MNRPPLSPADVAVDALATFRITRLIIADTVPPAAAFRRAVFRRWPVAGRPLDPTVWLPTETDGIYVHRRTGRKIRATAVPAESGTEVVATEDTPVGELITCYWCTSAWAAVGVVAARRYVPRVWDPLARALAASAVAGMIGGRARG